MATLAPGGRITIDVVDEEIDRLRSIDDVVSSEPGVDQLSQYFDREAIAAMDRFDRAQLSDVLSVCAESKSLSAAGRTLFQASRERKASKNDADRLRKYLARFGLKWQDGGIDLAE